MTARIDLLDRNFLINGAMKYFQRDTGVVALTTSAFYRGLDRFIIKTSGGLAAGNSNRSSGQVPPNGLSEHSLQLDITPTLIGHQVDVQQRIESIFVRPMNNQKVSLSMQVFSESADQIEIELRTADVKDDFSAVTPIAGTP